MRPFFACNSPDMIETLLEEGVTHILYSYAYCKRGVPDLLKAARAKKTVTVMIDSGAYTNIMSPGRVTFEGYCDFLKRNSAFIDEYIGLDDPKHRDVTLRNHDAMLKRGLKPHIVDHMWFNVDDAIKGVYRKGTKVCWGGMASGPNFPLGDWARRLIGKKYTPGNNRTYLHDPKIWEVIGRRLQERHTHARKAPPSPIHLLAVGARIRRFLPFLDIVDSFDSSSWSLGTGYGRCAMFVPAEGDQPPKIKQFKSNNGVPEQYRAQIKEYKLDPTQWKDRRRICIREMAKYYKAVEDYYRKLKAKGWDALWAASMMKSEDGELDSAEDLFDAREIAYNYPDLFESMVKLDASKYELARVTPQTLYGASDDDLFRLHDSAHDLLRGGR